MLQEGRRGPALRVVEDVRYVVELREDGFASCVFVREVALAQPVAHVQTPYSTCHMFYIACDERAIELLFNGLLTSTPSPSLSGPGAWSIRQAPALGGDF